MIFHRGTVGQVALMLAAQFVGEAVNSAQGLVYVVDGFNNRFRRILRTIRQVFVADAELADVADRLIDGIFNPGADSIVNRVLNFFVKPFVGNVFFIGFGKDVFFNR